LKTAGRREFAGFSITNYKSEITSFVSNFGAASLLEKDLVIAKRGLRG
jgi:hypothetical protein